MSELVQLAAVVKYELLKQSKRRRFYAVLGLAILIETFLLIFAIGTKSPLDVYISAAFLTIPALLLSALAAIFFSTDAIAGEYAEKTGYILFANPIRYRTLVVGKFIACLGLTLVILLISYAFTAAAILGSFGQVPAEMLLSLLHAALFLWSVVAMTFVFSSVLRSGVGAAIVMMILFLVVLPIVHGGMSNSGVATWFLPTSGIPPIFTAYLARTTIPFLGLTVPYEAWPSPFVMLAYLAVFLCLSVFLTKRRAMV